MPCLAQFSTSLAECVHPQPLDSVQHGERVSGPQVLQNCFSLFHGCHLGRNDPLIKTHLNAALLRHPFLAASEIVSLSGMVAAIHFFQPQRSLAPTKFLLPPNSLLHCACDFLTPPQVINFGLNLIPSTSVSICHWLDRPFGPIPAAVLASQLGCLLPLP